MANSTIPAAITTLQGYMQTVAAASAVDDVQVYVGNAQPPTGRSYNYLMVGDFETNLLVSPSESGWASMGVTAKRRTETYALNGTIVCWAGGNDWQARMNDAFSLLNALEVQIVSDPGGSNNLTPSGSWGNFNYRPVATGPFENIGGYGFVIGFELHVINAQLQG